MGILTVNCAVFAVGGDAGGDGKNASGSEKNSSNKSPMGSVYTMIAAVAIGVGLGVYLDGKFGTRPWCTLGLSMLFLVAGFYNIIRESSK